MRILQFVVFMSLLSISYCGCCGFFHKFRLFRQKKIHMPPNINSAVNIEDHSQDALLSSSDSPDVPPAPAPPPPSPANSEPESPTSDPRLMQIRNLAERLAWANGRQHAHDELDSQGSPPPPEHSTPTSKSQSIRSSSSDSDRDKNRAGISATKVQIQLSQKM